MKQFKTDLFFYDKDENSFTAYSSDLDLPAREWNSLRHIPVETQIELMNPKTGNCMLFEFRYADVKNGEAMGWNYRSKNYINLLIIND